MESCKEALLRKWYNLHDTSFEEGESKIDKDQVLCQSDSDIDEVLLQSDSDEAMSVCLQSDSDKEDVMLQTSSDDEKLQGQAEQPLKKRRYHARTDQTAVQLKFLQKPVCKWAHLRLYGVGSSALQNLRDGRRAFTMHEGRLEEPKHPTLGVSLGRQSINTKWPNILVFFAMLYISVAEIMPTKFVMPSAGMLAESFLDKDPDFEERYTRSFMSTIEKNFDLTAVSWLCQSWNLTFLTCCS